VLVDTSIVDHEPLDEIRAWPRVVLQGLREVRALATHVERALVFFSDVDTGAIYRTQRNHWTVNELTVQQPHVEGNTPAIYAGGATIFKAGGTHFRPHRKPIREYMKMNNEMKMTNVFWTFA